MRIHKLRSNAVLWMCSMCSTSDGAKQVLRASNYTTHACCAAHQQHVCITHYIKTHRATGRHNVTAIAIVTVGRICLLKAQQRQRGSCCVRAWTCEVLEQHPGGTADAASGYLTDPPALAESGCCRLRLHI